MRPRARNQANARHVRLVSVWTLIRPKFRPEPDTKRTRELVSVWTQIQPEFGPDLPPHGLGLASTRTRDIKRAKPDEMGRPLGVTLVTPCKAAIRFVLSLLYVKR